MVFVPAIFKDKIYDNGSYNTLNKTKIIDQELLISYSELYYLPEITDFNNDQNTFSDRFHSLESLSLHIFWWDRREDCSGAALSHHDCTADWQARKRFLPARHGMRK